ncbi:choice-of-anchor I family protein [Cellvibrio sp. UBA7671]|uniref:choice-of-anchor I family protein n=1 Tax=Cellvibrio sp. UBA7671 TaxID=1946312 RepID=UPI002F34F38F
MKLIQQIPQLAALAAVSLTLVACGGDDNKSSSSASSSSQLSSSVSSVTSSLASSVASSTASSVAASVAPTPAPQIVLNEMRSDGGGYDYIELYNAANTDYTFTANEWAVNDIKGFAEDKVPGIVIPAGTVISAKGFLLVAVDQSAIPFGAPASTLIGGTANFGLGKGDTALLVYKNEILDQKKWGEGTHINAFGRLPDGAEWHVQTEALEATPGASNKLPAVVAPAGPTDIVINEIVSSGRADINFDYIEIYNKGEQPYTFAAGEWTLTDTGNKPMPIPGGTEIPAKGRIILLTDLAVGADLPANAPAGAILNGGVETFGIGKKETITLFYKGEQRDQISYGDFHVNSFGRLPDGGNWIDLADASKPQLYASPALKNFATPALNLTVTTLNFSSYNNQETTLEAGGFRIFGLNADLAKDVEPEYIAVAADSKTAWVSLQENNGLARINLNGTPAITNVFPLGFKDYGAIGNEIDPSDKDSKIAFAKYPKVFGMYQPDGIATFNEGGMDYVITANEGDVRDYYTNFVEGVKVSGLTLDESDFPNAVELKKDAQLGRLVVTQFAKSSTAETLYSDLLSFGARSFSIWNGTTGAQVYDSGKDLEVQANTANAYPDDRSDAKGVEPENLTIGMIGSKRFVFVGLERADAVAVYDITDISNISFKQFLKTTGDDAPEGILFVSAADSPNGNPLLVVSNEDSGNVTVYQSDANGVFSFASRLVLEGGAAAAEISAYDPITKHLFVLNNGTLLKNSRIEVLNLADPTKLSLLTTIDLSPYAGGINSVAVKNGKLAGALQGVDKTQQGTVVVFDTSTYALLGIAKVGALPDMLTFSPDGKFILTADEGEAKDDYSYDPVGSVSIIALP